MPEAFACTAAAAGSAPAFFLPDGGITHAALDQAAARAQTTLLRLGAGPGRAVLLSATTSLPTLIAYIAVLRTGAAVALANPSYTPSELSRLIAASDADLAIATGEGVKRLAATSVPVRELIGLAVEDRQHASLLLFDRSEEPAPVVSLNPDAPAVLAFTSGTTGEAKCVPLSHRNLLASIRGVMWAWRWSANDRLVHALPIAHQHGLGGVHATLLAGSQATLLGRFDPEQLLDAVVTEATTVLFAVPTIYRRLAEEAFDRLALLKGLRLFTSGSSALPLALGQQLIEEIGTPPLERYGTTESGLDVSNLYEGPRVLGTVGMPLPGVELALGDGDGKTVSVGEVGEVLVRGPQVFNGYRGDRIGDDPFIFDWFRTGDLGVQEASGHLRLVGRTKEVIVSGGLNVYPKEVEAVLAGLPGVEDVAVVGMPSSAWGEEVVAFVVGQPISEEDLRRAASAELVSYKIPKRFVRLEKIPRNELGKVSREGLLAQGVVPPETPGI
ncbi:MAG TPA: AMP-binding protein [Acidimicrobiia bacterium]|nr:AMP-binding protein [Acidimicrobiia bacterium]